MSKSRKRKGKFKIGKPDSFLLIVIIAMAIFGAIMVFDASMYIAYQTEEFQSIYYFLIRHVIWLAIGGAAGFFVYLVDYKKILKFSLPIMVAVIFSLLLVLLFGRDVNGSKRWFIIPGVGQIQPAEFAKIAVILYLSSWLSTKEFKYKNLEGFFKEGVLKHLLSFLAIIMSTAIFILLQPDLGTTMIICVTAFAMFLLSGEDQIHTWGSLILVGLIGLPLATIAALIAPYRLQRVKTFVDLLIKGTVTDPKGSGYQIQQILIGIGSGGFFGKGFGQSRQRFGYLVENTAFTDSIFAIILEELGFLGGTILVIAWILLFLRGLKVAQNAPDKEGKILASGIIIWLTMQAFFNMGANVGLIPLTGIPLPLLTYGGSSTVVTLLGIAILLNISKQTKLNGK